MHWIRQFSQNHAPARERNIEDAPQEMRAELVDFFFYLAGESYGRVHPRTIHDTTGLMLGVGIAAQPQSGYPARVARDIRGADWPRVYDWISRISTEFERANLAEPFRDGVNVILAANGVVWELNEAGQWQRVLAQPLREQVDAAIVQLARQEFAPALQLFNAAMEAFNARPRRDRDACANAFDALESVAKIIQQMPNSTFGQVLDEIRRQPGRMNEQIQRLLRDVEVLRHDNFGHGMAQVFALQGAEVDFVFTICAAGIRLFTG